MNEVIFAAFADELQKIAGELQGHTRSGRRPISVDRLLAREAESELTPSDIVDDIIDPEVEKEAGAKPFMGRGARAMALVGTGALGLHIGKKANEDRKLGRQIRLQQGM